MLDAGAAGGMWCALQLMFGAGSGVECWAVAWSDSKRLRSLLRGEMRAALLWNEGAFDRDYWNGMQNAL